KQNISNLYASMFQENSNLMWEQILTEDNYNVFESVIINSEYYYGVLKINDYNLLLNAINKIENSNFDYNYDCIISEKFESKLLKENFSYDLLTKIVKGVSIEAKNEFFKNDYRATHIWTNFDTKYILSLASEGIEFNDQIIESKEFFDRLKSDDLITFRNNISTILSSNSSVYLEQEVSKYYEYILSSYDSESQLFSQYLESDINWSSNDIILNSEMRYFVERDTAKAIEKTNQIISEVVVDGLFKDNIYNVRINIIEMLRFNEMLPENEKILDLNMIEFYKGILNIDSISVENKINLYNILKNKNISESFYDNIRALKDKSYELIGNDIVKLEEHNDLLNNEMSNQLGTLVYDYRNKEFFTLIRYLRSGHFNELISQKLECFSLISNNNTNRYGDTDSYVFGYSDIDPKQIIWVHEGDSFTISNRFDTITSTNRIATSNQIVNANNMSEINIATKEASDGKYESLKPSYIVCFDNISNEAVEESKRLSIPIMLVSDVQEGVSTNELGEYQWGRGYVNQHSSGIDKMDKKLEERLNNSHKYNEEELSKLYNAVNSINNNSISDNIEVVIDKDGNILNIDVFKHEVKELIYSEEISFEDAVSGVNELFSRVNPQNFNKYFKECDFTKEEIISIMKNLQPDIVANYIVNSVSQSDTTHLLNELFDSYGPPIKRQNPILKILDNFTENENTYNLIKNKANDLMFVLNFTKMYLNCERKMFSETGAIRNYTKLMNIKEFVEQLSVSDNFNKLFDNAINEKYDYLAKEILPYVNNLAERITCDNIKTMNEVVREKFKKDYPLVFYNVLKKNNRTAHDILYNKELREKFINFNENWIDFGTSPREEYIDMIYDYIVNGRGLSNSHLRYVLEIPELEQKLLANDKVIEHLHSNATAFDADFCEYLVKRLEYDDLLYSKIKKDSVLYANYEMEIINNNIELKESRMNDFIVNFILKVQSGKYNNSIAHEIIKNIGFIENSNIIDKFHNDLDSFTNEDIQELINYIGVVKLNESV
ncbi:MAG: hypothetical protein IJZ79_05945, partial [Bacilli bacterium]|nr:hypothetical protein [Bacilli bacterium]